MSEPKYLYGASIQGIQGFIFKTNELKDIVGASELVEKICTETFAEYAKEGSIVVNAAGNVKCIFNTKEACQKAVSDYPKKVMEMAPGITISQAVVTLLPDMSDFPVQVEELEKRLHVQRNKPLKAMTVGTIAMLRSRKTGLPAVKTIRNKKGQEEYLDEATFAKRRLSRPDSPENSTLKLAKKSFGNDNLSFKSIPLNIEDMTGRNNWIAIIHADGNGLGKIVSEKNKKPGDLYKFSVNLDQATVKAAQQTHDDIIKAEDYEPSGTVVPFRPVVLGGDDMTVICRADLAMKYAVRFIKHFEENTREAGDGLTACAGIAYMKSSYPFHYGYRLAEALCEEAKKDAKRPEHLHEGKAPSCIMFHKIQGSYISSFRQIETDELTTCDGGSLKFGPYYIEPMNERWTVDMLLDNTAALYSEEGNAVKSDIRKWLTLMTENEQAAEQLEKREMTILKGAYKQVFDIATRPYARDNDVKAYPAYDMLQLLTVENQITKKTDDINIDD